MRSRCFSGGRSAAAGACSRKTTWAGRTKAGPGAKARATARSAGSTGSCKAGTCRMFGPRSARGELAGCTRCALLESSWSTSRSAVENRFPALDACSLGRRRGRTGGNYRGRLVNRSRTGLRHHHTTRSGSRRSRRQFWSLHLWGDRSSCRGNDGLRRRFLNGSSRSGRGLRCCYRHRRSCDLWFVRRRRCRSRRRSLHRLRRDHHNGLRRRRSLVWYCCRLSLRSLGWRHRRWRSDHDALWRHYRHSRARRSNAGRCLGHHGSSWRLRSDGRGCRLHDRGSGPGLRHNLARLRSCGSGGRCCSSSRRWWGRLRWSLRNHGCRGFARRNQALACLCFLLLLFGQNSLHHVAWLGNVGKINLGSDRLGCARR